MSEGLRDRWRRIRRRPLAENVRRVSSRVARRMRETGSRLRVATRRDYALGSALAAAMKQGSSAGAIADRVRRGALPRFFVHADGRAGLVEAIARRQPDAARLAIEDAERILAHEIDLLGSGPVAYGDPIDWHRDPKTGFRWPPDVHHGSVRGIPQDPGSDVKMPWELSRAQFLPTLGRAYLYTGDERYAGEFVRLVSDWLDHDRPEAGVNWACTMDVAIRAVNWLWAWHLMAASPAVTDAFAERLVSGLLEHGRFIMRNLEGAPGEVNSNHYLSDVAGLVFLGNLLPELSEADAWRTTGEAAIVREMADQVLDDGVDWEMSTSYHRLVTEIFLTCALLMDLQGRRPPAVFMDRLSAMVDYTYHYTRPDGTAPMVGDADNGRLQRLTSWADPAREFVDHRHLLAAGACLLGREDWADGAGDCWEEAFWLFGESAEKTAAGATNADPGSRAYERAHVYAMRSGTLYTFARVGNEDAGGPDGHLHNDQLSFELFAGGPFLVDPGSYLYTADPEQRNAFRSSLAHNGVVVDGREANRFAPASLFEMPLESAPAVIRWETTDAYDVLSAVHSGYSTLPDPVVLRRSWLFDKIGRLWLVWDRVEAGGAHECLIPLQFAPGVAVTVSGGSRFATARSGGDALEMRRLAGPGLAASLTEGWVSPGYGVRMRAPRVLLSFASSGATDLVWALVPLRSGDEARVGDETASRVAHATELLAELLPGSPEAAV